MRIVVLVLGLLLSFGCTHHVTGIDPGGGGGAPDGGDPGNGYFAPSSLQVSGQVVDFATRQPLTTSMTMATAALSPPPTVTVNGASFTLDGVPPYSLFFLVAGGPPDHRITYNVPTAVTNAPLTGVTAMTVSNAYLGALEHAFGASVVPGTATVLVHVVDGKGAAQAGVPAGALALGVLGAKGPFFLDANLQPQPNATATSASGWMAFFEVPPATLKVSGSGGYSATAADTPAVADDVSLVEATVTRPGGTGTPPPPPPRMNVSFVNDVVPIFMRRGCYNCHSGNGAGRRLGGLVLDGAVMKIYAALTVDVSPNFHTTRVDLADPPKSLVLSMPSYSNPPNGHPTVVFASANDPDYQTILAWIQAGAKNN